MIAPLRRRHRRVSIGLALVLPVLYFAALRARSTVPATNALVETVERAYAVDGADGGARTLDVAWEGAVIETRLQNGGRVLELAAREDPKKPDVLVYWRPRAAEAPFLLGSLAGTQPRRYELPSEALESAGTLELYSLAHDEIVARGALPATRE